MKVVFDANIFISALVVPQGKAQPAYLFALDGEFELYTSLPILTETAGILRKKFHWDRDKIVLAVANIARVAQLVRPNFILHLLSDEPDNRILECAGAVSADFIVTGDKPLLGLRFLGGTQIISLADFLRKFTSNR